MEILEEILQNKVKKYIKIIIIEIVTLDQHLQIFNMKKEINFRKFYIMDIEFMNGI